MGKVKTAWQEQQETMHDDKRPTEPRINDPYNLWDTDDHDTSAIDINNWADTHDQENSMTKETNTPNNCWGCGEPVDSRRWAIGKRTCLTCGEEQAQTERKAWCVVPMPKSNYILVTDPSLLLGLNSSHKGVTK